MQSGYIQSDLEEAEEEEDLPELDSACARNIGSEGRRRGRQRIV